MSTCPSWCRHHERPEYAEFRCSVGEYAVPDVRMVPVGVSVDVAELPDGPRCCEWSHQTAPGDPIRQRVVLSVSSGKIEGGRIDLLLGWGLVDWINEAAERVLKPR